MLAGRKITPWAKSLGLGGGTIDAMRGQDSRPPSADALVRISRAENVNLSWLLDGKGPPFLTVVSTSDDVMAEDLEQELADQGWNIAILHADYAWALVLFQPVEASSGKTDYRYVDIEVLVGTMGRMTQDVLTGARARIVGQQTVSAETMAAIRDGHIGTWKLFGDGEKHKGLIDLNQARPLPIVWRVAEPQALGYEIPPIERLWPMMTDAERDALRTVLLPFLRQVEERGRE